jgi:hypothetical protein
MLFQQTHRFKTFRMGKKARSVTIGERGKEALFITPKPKPVFEFNSWVLADKFKLGILTVLCLLSGAVALTVFGWSTGFIIVCAAGFVVGFINGGDRESSP